MSLKLYYDLLSPPSRSLLLLLRTSKIPFEECPVALRKAEHLTEEYKNEVSRFQKVPVLTDGGFAVTESIAILRYLANKKQIPDLLYPNDSKAQARVDEYLEWQHNNTRTFVFLYFNKKWIEPFLSGESPDEKQVASYEKKLGNCFDNLEKLWLRQSAYIAGNQISAADIWAACEVEQPRVAGYDPEHGRPILSKWLNNVRKGLSPHYEDVHSVVNKFAAKVAAETKK